MLEGDETADPASLLGLNLTHGMLDYLGKAIVTGHYDEARFPTEAQLARQHGVSRSVTREAVKMLTAKGLVSARPRQGTVVCSPSSWSLFDPDVLRWLLDREFSLDLLQHFTELRIAIEPEAAALAAARNDSGGTAAIGAALEMMVAADSNWDDPLTADLAFHVAVLRAANNPFYQQFEPVVRTALRSSIRLTNRLMGRGGSISEHRSVFEAIRDQDIALARTSMRALIENVRLLIAAARQTADDRGPRYRTASLVGAFEEAES